VAAKETASSREGGRAGESVMQTGTCHSKA
jgi:hypothetical protein